MNKVTFFTFLDRAKAKHGDKFDYSKAKFINMEKEITIICPIHGETKQTPFNHCRSVYGCRACGEAAAAASKEHTTEQFITQANLVHNNKYSYDKTIYVRAKEKVIITCPEHGDFSQLASGHLSGYGCNKCTSYGKGRVDMHKPCTLYYLNVKGTDVFKIGITTQTINTRYRSSFDKDQIIVVFTKVYSTGREAYNEEQRILKLYSDLKYTSKPLLSSGNTELFKQDIFDGDYSAYTTTIGEKG